MNRETTDTDIAPPITQAENDRPTKPPAPPEPYEATLVRLPPHPRTGFAATAEPLGTEAIVGKLLLWSEEFERKFDDHADTRRKFYARFDNWVDRFEQRLTSEIAERAKLTDCITALLLNLYAKPPAKRLEGCIILVVEDNDILREQLARICAAEGAEIMKAASVDTGLAWIESHEASVAAVDLKLGPDDGMQLVREISRNHPSVGILIISGLLNSEQAREAGELGALVILKPFTPDELIDAIRLVRKPVPVVR